MTIRPQAAPIFAPSQIEDGQSSISEILGVLELPRCSVRICDLRRPIQIIVIGCDRVSVRICYSADAVRAVASKDCDCRRIVERRACDRSQITVGNRPAVGKSGGFILRIFAGEHLPIRSVCICRYLAGGIGVGERLVLRIVSKLPHQFICRAGRLAHL